MKIKDFMKKFPNLYKKIEFELNKIKKEYELRYFEEYESNFYFEDDILPMLKDAFNFGYNMRGLTK